MYMYAHSELWFLVSRRYYCRLTEARKYTNFWRRKSRVNFYSVVCYVYACKDGMVKDALSPLVALAVWFEEMGCRGSSNARILSEKGQTLANHQHRRHSAIFMARWCVVYYELLKPNETVSMDRYQQQLDALDENFYQQSIISNRCKVSLHNIAHVANNVNEALLEM